ncbi:MAG: hypothetical protein WC878_01490 [Candidatus Paceibacterota bacterium]|jgi:hypothetical protein
MEKGETAGIESKKPQEIIIHEEAVDALKKDGYVKVFEKPSNVNLGEEVMLSGEGFSEPVPGCYKQIGADIMLVVEKMERK